MTLSHDKTAPVRRGALGKGLNSLLADVEIGAPSPAHSGSLAGAVIRIRLHDIEPNPHQPRKLFDNEALKDLAGSLKEDGVIQPILVSRTEQSGRYLLIAGERRWRAAHIAGMETIPAIVKEGTPNDMLRLALIENIQRADLNAIEEAEAYASLIRDFGLTQEQCAAKVSKERSTVANALRLLALPRDIQDDLMDGRLTMGHGRAMLTLDDPKAMLRARDIVVKKQLSVRQTEQLCKTIKSEPEEGQAERAVKPKSADLEYLADTLRSHLKTKVRFVGNENRGKMEISYFSNTELERILSVIGPRLG